MGEMNTSDKEKNVKIDVEINVILKEAVNRKASDVHLKAGAPPIYRINTELSVEDDFPVFSPEDLQRFFEQVTTLEQQKYFVNNWELDFAFAAAGIGRFRVNAYRQVGTIGMAFRLVQTEIPDLELLMLPPVCRDLALKREGLIILTGPTGCGKSTTMAAMLGYLNKSVKRNVVTIEDPIEYLHTDIKSVFNQREVGVDTQSFANALKHVLRQDPDVILIGEMRDLETMSIALTAAETGHLVLTTLHTSSAPEAINRIIDGFPPHQQEQIRLQLSTTLQGILYQNLIPRDDKAGIVPAVEVLINTPAISNMIREGKTHQILTYIHSGKSTGMQTLDQALINLQRRGLISKEEAQARSRDPSNYHKGE
jgi:twitching motility protein PilT